MVMKVMGGHKKGSAEVDCYKFIGFPFGEKYCHLRIDFLLE